MIPEAQRGAPRPALLSYFSLISPSLTHTCVHALTHVHARTHVHTLQPLVLFVMLSLCRGACLLDTISRDESSRWLFVQRRSSSRSVFQPAEPPPMAYLPPPSPLQERRMHIVEQRDGQPEGEFLLSPLWVAFLMLGPPSACRAAEEGGGGEQAGRDSQTFICSCAQTACLCRQACLC